MESFSTRDVARLLGLSETQVRSQARAGFLTLERGPRNGYRFSFQDLVLLRTARELAQARIPLRRIRTALCGLARDLPSGRSLSEVRIVADGDDLLVHEGGTAWNPESGQVQIDFAGSAPKVPAAHAATSLPPHSRPRDQVPDAWELFDAALELEASDPAAALRTYAQALTQNPHLSDAHVNLGRLLQLAGRTEEALEHYLAAIRAGSTDPTAPFNLGTALEELGRWRDALAAYQHAIETDASFADAHFNLARLYDQLGRRAEAIRHLRAYKRLVEG
jgi:tetratricopeptide (TPR) repeat protein